MTSQDDGLLLAIESSCDETAAAVIDRRLNVLSNVVSSQSELHARFGGVVPEIASRAHVRRIIPAIDEALRSAGVRLDQLTAVAVTSRPGLVGSLLVGLTAAKTLALALDLPLIDVSHVEAHLYACRMSAGRDVFPAVGLVVSGGHTLLYDCAAAVDFHLLGSTIDDAAGEAFDKGAKLLGLGYPGGPAIQKASKAQATAGRRCPLSPAAARAQQGLDFSFQWVEDCAAARDQRLLERLDDGATRTLIGADGRSGRLVSRGDRRRAGCQVPAGNRSDKAKRLVGRRRSRSQWPLAGATGHDGPRDVDRIGARSADVVNGQRGHGCTGLGTLRSSNPRTARSRCHAWPPARAETCREKSPRVARVHGAAKFALFALHREAPVIADRRT